MSVCAEAVRGRWKPTGYECLPSTSMTVASGLVIFWSRSLSSAKSAPVELMWLALGEVAKPQLAGSMCCVV